MTNERDDIDKELKAYLEGKDSLSATYREMDSAEPSVKLDAHILQAARDELAQNTQQPAQAAGNSIYSRPYGIAASVLLGILIGVMIAPQPPEATNTSGFDSLSKAPASFQAETESTFAPKLLIQREQGTMEIATANANNAVSSATGQTNTRAANAMDTNHYRANANTWLEEIRRLQEDAQTRQAMLEAELTLFRESHPDIELPELDLPEPE